MDQFQTVEPWKWVRRIAFLVISAFSICALAYITLGALVDEGLRPGICHASWIVLNVSDRVSFRC